MVSNLITRKCFMNCTFMQINVIKTFLFFFKTLAIFN